jgi:hypothetical protein
MVGGACRFLLRRCITASGKPENHYKNVKLKIQVQHTHIPHEETMN